MRRHIPALAGAIAGLMLASAPALALSIDFIDLETKAPAAAARVVIWMGRNRSRDASRMACSGPTPVD